MEVAESRRAEPRAAQAYQMAAEQRPHSPGLLYNMGTVFYRTGEFPRALEHFEPAARESRRDRLAMLAHYNAASSSFKHAVSVMRADAPGARALLERAAGHCTEA